MNTAITRRSFLGRAAVAGAGVALSPILAGKARAQVHGGGRLLFTIAAVGGGSIIDSMLPILDTETSNTRLGTYEASLVAQPNGSNLRCVKSMPTDIQGIAVPAGFSPETFLAQHHRDVVVMAHEVTSVNHLVAAKRAMNGAGVNRGMTIPEAVALRHGGGLLLPNVNMAPGGYGEAGDDPTLPLFARGEPVADARFFALATDARRGVTGAPSADVVERGRKLRGLLEERSSFVRSFKRRGLLSDYLSRRDEMTPRLESADLITKLMVVTQTPGGAPITDHDLASSPDAALLASTFPKLATDTFEAQAALAFLLCKNGFTCAVTMAPGGLGGEVNLQEGGLPPLGFDFSHTQHRTGQNTNWSKIFEVTHGLIGLLKKTDYLGVPEQGRMWDRSLVYVATEFGRDKELPNPDAGSGHHLNNGSILVSPLLKGNRFYGGLDTETGLTHGFDPITGEPAPGRVIREGELYSAIAHALDVDFDGRTDMPCMVKG